MSMLKVAIVGCGKIAEQHVVAINRIAGARLVGVCDSERLMAEQIGERYRVAHVSDSVAALLGAARPDVVHITTPPASHCSLALECLRAGAHVYVEKPFTIDTREASALIDAAQAASRLVMAGHNLQFTWENHDARELIAGGFLGGAPVHLESYYTYGLGDAQYAKALLGDRQHWVRRLPGRLLHNIISHGIARIAEHMHADDPVVHAFGHSSPLLQQIGETDIVDELRVHIWDRRNTTATFVFSSQLAPPVNGVRVYGPKGSITVDNVHHTMTRVPKRGYKSYLNYFVPPLHQAADQLANARRNVTRFVKAEFHDDSGLKSCIESFYRAIADGTEPPVSYREVLLTSRIMDAIFEQLAAQHGAVVPRREAEAVVHARG
jgi:predicted dehydrogenase